MIGRIGAVTYQAMTGFPVSRIALISSMVAPVFVFTPGIICSATQATGPLKTP